MNKAYSYYLAVVRFWLRRWRLRLKWEPEWSSPRWFNIDGPMLSLFTPWRFHLYIRPWSLFNRRCADGDHYWGFGLLQINNRFLFAHMFSGTSILFIGRIP